MSPQSPLVSETEDTLPTCPPQILSYPAYMCRGTKKSVVLSQTILEPWLDLPRWVLWTPKHLTLAIRLRFCIRWVPSGLTSAIERRYKALLYWVFFIVNRHTFTLVVSLPLLSVATYTSALWRSKACKPINVSPPNSTDILPLIIETQSDKWILIANTFLVSTYGERERERESAAQGQTVYTLPSCKHSHTMFCMKSKSCSLIISFGKTSQKETNPRQAPRCATRPNGG